MNLIRVSTGDNFDVDYDKDRGMYRVSVFEDCHFQDEYWFDAYEEKEVTNKTKLIGYLEMLKENSKEVLGEHKFLRGVHFREILDKIIEYINNME